MTLDAYGRETCLKGEAGTCPFRYQGQYADPETGLYYNRFRYYDPQDGRYISPDPIGLASGELGMYNYVPDPNEWVDVFGLAGYNNKEAKEAAEILGYVQVKGQVHGKAVFKHPRRISLYLPMQMVTLGACGKWRIRFGILDQRKLASALSTPILIELATRETHELV
jgi:RHS repeat-associated protein